MKDADNPQRHLQTTSHSRRYVTTRPHFLKPNSVLIQSTWYPTVLAPSLREQLQSVLLRASQCGHPAMTLPLMTMSTTPVTPLLLFADTDIAPVLLSSLSDVDELMVALGCRFASDVFTAAQKDRPLPVLTPLAHDPGLAPGSEL